jgi:hypothetical protein
MIVHRRPESKATHILDPLEIRFDVTTVFTFLFVLLHTTLFCEGSIQDGIYYTLQ